MKKNSSLHCALFGAAIAVAALLVFEACSSPTADDPSLDGSGVNADGGSGDLDGGGEGSLGDGSADEDAGPPCDPKADGGPLACRWRWLTPTPTGDNLYGVFAFADDDVFAVTIGGRLFHRGVDGWKAATVQPPKSSTSSFGGTNDGHLYALDRAAGNVLHSPDHGASWVIEPLPQPSVPEVDSALAVDRTSGWAVVVGSNKSLKTRDPATGVWSMSSVDHGNFNGAYLGSSRWFAVGQDGASGFIATTAAASPGGWTTTTTVPAGTPALYGACSATTGATTRHWAVGAQGTILSSLDGIAWTKQAAPYTPTLLGCAAVDASTAFAFGGGGGIFSTTDGGATWTLVPINAAAFDLQAATKSPSGTVTLVGLSGTLLRMIGTTLSIDYGGIDDNWTAITALSKTELYAAGAGGAIARTTDGRHWNRLSTNQPSASLIALWAASPTDIYAVGNGVGGVENYILHSTDGVTFTRFAAASGGLPGSPYLSGVGGVNANRVFVSATTGVYRSTDMGASWTLFPIDGLTGEVSAVYGDASGVWIGGSSGRLFHSADGDNFTLVQIPGVDGTTYIRHVTSDSVGNVYASLTNGALAHITGGGANVTMSAGVDFEAFGVSPSGASLYGATRFGVYGSNML